MFLKPPHHTQTHIHKPSLWAGGLKADNTGLTRRTVVAGWGWSSGTYLSRGVFSLWLFRPIDTCSHFLFRSLSRFPSLVFVDPTYFPIFFWHLPPSLPHPFYYLTSCDYEAPDKGLSLFTLSKVHKPPPFISLSTWLAYCCAGSTLHSLFLKGEATDLNKRPSIMNTPLKLQKLAGSCLIKLHALLSGGAEWVDGWLVMEIFFKIRPSTIGRCGQWPEFESPPEVSEPTSGLKRSMTVQCKRLGWHPKDWLGFSLLA